LVLVVSPADTATATSTLIGVVDTGAFRIVTTVPPILMVDLAATVTFHVMCIAIPTSGTGFHVVAQAQS
jgi:hypothetical protein